jgi:hypothetical protein
LNNQLVGKVITKVPKNFEASVSAAVAIGDNEKVMTLVNFETVNHSINQVRREIFYISLD